MKILIKILLIFCVFFKLPSYALDIVYPKKHTPTIHAKSTFFIGNIGKDKEFYINNNKIQTYKDGIFVVVVPLEHGVNNFLLKSISKEGKVSTATYQITRPKPSTTPQSNTKPTTTSFKQYTVAEIIKDNIPLRKDNNDNSDRIVHLQKGTKLLLDGKNGNNYRVYANNNTKYWIKANYIKELYQSSTPIISCLDEFQYSYDKKFEYFIFNTNENIPYKLKEHNNGIEVTFYYVSQIPQNLDKFVQNIRFEDNTLTFFIPHKKLWGYDCYFENNNMIFRLTREVKTDAHNPLKDIVIAIDAGHGGTEAGAIGPTRIREAEIVLDISKKLQRLLISEGAKVLMTRTKNENVDLYKRVELIKEVNPLFSISIHANALPDGANPYERYGTSVYYYYPQAKDFANTLKENMTAFLNTRDDGTRHGSFVLTRMTSPISVLIETAYMINPFDYEKLNDEKFRLEIAKSIVRGIKAYLNSIEPK